MLMVLLLTGTAHAGDAHTRESIMMIEGSEETIIETLYESPQGFRIWYPADLFVVTHEKSNDYFDTNPEYADAGVAITEEQMSYEDIEEMLSADIELSLANDGIVPEAIEAWQMESGLNVKYVNIIFNDVYSPLYYLYENDRVFCISCYYPVEAAEGIGARIEKMISSFEWIE